MICDFAFCSSRVGFFSYSIEEKEKKIMVRAHSSDMVPRVWLFGIFLDLEQVVSV